MCMSALRLHLDIHLFDTSSLCQMNHIVWMLTFICLNQHSCTLARQMTDNINPLQTCGHDKHMSKISLDTFPPFGSVLIQCMLLLLTRKHWSTRSARRKSTSVASLMRWKHKTRLVAQSQVELVFVINECMHVCIGWSHGYRSSLCLWYMKACMYALAFTIVLITSRPWMVQECECRLLRISTCVDSHVLISMYQHMCWFTRFDSHVLIHTFWFTRVD